MFEVFGRYVGILIHIHSSWNVYIADNLQILFEIFTVRKLFYFYLIKSFKEADKSTKRVSSIDVYQEQFFK